MMATSTCSSMLPAFSDSAVVGRGHLSPPQTMERVSRKSIPSVSQFIHGVFTILGIFDTDRLTQMISTLLIPNLLLLRLKRSMAKMLLNG